MDADHAAFLEAIKASPDDDAPRLVYADYLRENGDPDRGDFIGVQVKLGRLADCGHYEAVFFLPPDTPLACRRCALRRQERELLENHAERWALPVHVSRPLRSDLFRRGFLESLTLTAAGWLQHADALLAAHPVREVRLTGEPGSEAGFHEIRTLGGDHYWSHPRWPGVRFHLPEPGAGPRVYRNRGTYEAPDWEPVGYLARASHELEDTGGLTQAVAESAAAFGRAVDQAREAVRRFADAAPEASLAPPDSARRRPGHSRLPDWLAERERVTRRRPR